MEELNKLRNAKHDFSKFDDIKQSFYLMDLKKFHEEIIKTAIKSKELTSENVKKLIFSAILKNGIEWQVEAFGEGDILANYVKREDRKIISIITKEIFTLQK